MDKVEFEVIPTVVIIVIARVIIVANFRVFLNPTP